MVGCRAPKVRILLTAFRPFRPSYTGGTLWEYNTSELLVKYAVASVDGRQWLSRLKEEGVEVIFDEDEDLLHVTFAAVERKAAEIGRRAEAENLDIIIHFGQHSVNDVVLVETTARNRNGTSPDVADTLGDQADISYGIQCLGQHISMEKSDDFCLPSTLPVSELLKIEGTRKSDNAGSYLCNNMFFKSRLILEKCYPTTWAGFIHVPSPPDAKATREEGNTWISGEAGQKFVQTIRSIIETSAREKLSKGGV